MFFRQSRSCIGDEDDGTLSSKVYLQISILIQALFSTYYTVSHFIINFLMSAYTMMTQNNRPPLLQNKISYNQLLLG